MKPTKQILKCEQKISAEWDKNKLNISKPTGNLYLRNEKDKVIVNITDVKGSTIKNQIGFRMFSIFHFRK
jgi:hypothetical protein